MIVGVLTTCHTQYTWGRSICIFFYLMEQHSKFSLHTLQVLYTCTICDSTNINTINEFVPNWQVVKTPTIISNNPVLRIRHAILFVLKAWAGLRIVVFSLRNWAHTVPTEVSTWNCQPLIHLFGRSVGRWVCNWSSGLFGSQGIIDTNRRTDSWLRFDYLINC